MRCLILPAVLALVCADSSHRLSIKNGCDQPRWIAHIASSGVGPDAQDKKIMPGQVAQFNTGVAGLSATRFWPKMGCSEAGGNCSIGDSGGPAEACVIRVPGKPDDYSHCAPPVDSKFEATFAAPGTPAKDIVDMSLVDGYSLPFKLEITWGACSRSGQPFQEMDCSDLSLSKCPMAEQLNGKATNLHAVNPKTGKVAGCFSPCMRLVDDKWQSTGVDSASPQAAPYCCAGADGQPQTCNAGPIMQTQYLKTVKGLCPEAYGYAFDDKTSTIACSTDTQYLLTFYCPAEFDQSPLTI